MYKYIILITMILALSSAGNIYGQTESEVLQTEQAVRTDGKYGILVMKAQHLKAAILTGKQLKDKSQLIDFQILVCGQLVKEISNEVDLQEDIRKSVADNGLKILVCGLSIQQFQVDKTNLPKEASITENGLLYMFGLQEQGYKTVIL
ncbi:MAG TPA: hypothetical protein VK957_23405 [Lunatimonas sp.]|nr:hypothetical protein [Lunatimonas sp.]